jgi:Amt family ammonium transporter
MSEVNTTQLLLDLAALTKEVSGLHKSTDDQIMMLTASNCFLMFLGFMLLEAGSLGAKNVNAVMLKKFIVACVVGVVWYLWGFAIAFGVDEDTPNNFIGTKYFALSDVVHNKPSIFSDWFYQFTFCTVACCILSGSIGERVKFEVYVIFVLILAGWVYPIAAYSQWSTGGWNSPFNSRERTGRLPMVGDEPYVGVIDFAGCGPIHMLGGVAAFFAAWLAGPRKGRFDPKTREPVPMPGHNQAYVAMGTIVLWYGWFSFNAGGKITDQKNHYLIVGRSNMNTVISSSVAGITVLLYRFIRSGFVQWDLGGGLNGVLCGLVGITAGSCVFAPWAAFVTGLLAGLLYIFNSYFVTWVLRVDDPVDAVAVHYGSGLFGLLIAGFLAEPHAVRVAYGNNIPDAYSGVFMGGGGKLLGYQLLAIVFITLWSSFFAFVYFFVADKVVGLRYSAADEEVGLDALRFGGQGLDYLSPLQQVDALTKALTALRETIADGNPSGGLQQNDASRSSGGPPSVADDQELGEDLNFGDNNNADNNTAAANRASSSEPTS